MTKTSSKFRRLGLAAIMSILLGAGVTIAQSSGDSLEQGFQNPPNGARPRVWWHWMNGNITQEGINLDLEWMKRVGLGGFQNFDAALNTPQVVKTRLVYMTPEWKDAFLFATKKADQLGLEEAIAGSPGWSESGGPWVPPSQAMKKIVWSETQVEGGSPFTGTLPKPPTTTGPFQSLPFADFRSANSTNGLPPAPPKEFYADSAVVAYREPAAYVSTGELKPKTTSSGGQIDPAVLTGRDLKQTTSLPVVAPGKQAWIQFEFAKPEAIDAVTMIVIGGNARRGIVPPSPVLQQSSDGTEFKEVASIPTDGAVQHTVAFPQVAARYFRVAFTTPEASAAGSAAPQGAPPVSAPTEYKIAKLVLHFSARVNRFEEKAGFAPLADLYPFATPPVAAADAISKSTVLDLTSKMRPDGTLDWTPPPGHWVVLRMGYSLLGITNHPASPEATGLEVDKLNADYVKAYFNRYLDNYKDTVGPLMGKRGLQYVITDSWEAGTQNWTDNMIAEFTRRRGYDPLPWMPVLTGRVVESSAASDRFLWDFRKTIADLVAENHYGEIASLLHARGMGQYGESHESGRATIGDGMEMKRSDDVPMAAMWTQLPGVNAEQFGYNADIRESASVAHIYGQNIVAAESLTARFGAWSWSPETLKPTADKELAMGLNRFVIHTSVHQPLVGPVPGLGLGPYGQWFNRNETWAEEAKPWVTYLARSSYLLQQGQFVADILYFYGEDSNLTAIFRSKSPDVPAGYNFDYVNADALIHKLSVKNGHITTPSGMNYQVLALDPYSQHMSLSVLRGIKELVANGATVVGARPTDDPSQADDPKEFRTIADQLWGEGTAASGEHDYGKGKVYSGQPLTATLSSVLTGMQVPKDFNYSKPMEDTQVLFVHRKLADGDLYWVDSRNDHAQSVDATLRVQGKAPELWHADTGVVEPAAYRIENGSTTVPLQLDPFGTVFVVFRKTAAEQSRTLPTMVETQVVSVSGPWNVSFQPGRGAPAKLTLDQLTSWSDSADQGVKYFSGQGTYIKTVDAPRDWFKPGTQLWLDLGDVKNLADVAVNGKPLGIVWKAPFKVDVTNALKPGANLVEVKVTNLWVNRLIGDMQPDAVKKYTFTTQKFYEANSPLLPSGLLGPVKLVRYAAK